jgi:predicted transposase YbfD/YdcC
MRRHRGVDWVLNLVFDEDAGRLRKDNLAVLRYIALTLLR